MAKILIVTRANLEEHSGSSFHLRNMIECLRNAGHEIYCSIFSHNVYDLPLTSVELKMVSASLLTCEPDVVIADYSWMANAFDVVKAGVLKIVFVHDLRCRIVPCLQKIGYEDHQQWTEEKEAVLLRRADIIMVLNDKDGVYCQDMAANVRIIRIGIVMNQVEHDPAKEVPGRMVFVCSGSVENEWAINWFHKYVWPHVIAEVPHAHLDIVNGFSEDLDERYAKAQLAVVPHIMKGGLKIKTAEAFAHGLPVVGNVCAFDGFCGWPLASDDPKRMAEMIINCIINYDAFYDFSKDAQEMCKNYMTTQAAYGQLLDILV